MPASRSTCPSVKAMNSGGSSARSRRAFQADGAVVKPADIHGTLIESIIEVDDAVTERYFEGTLPTDEELSRLIVEAVAMGSVVPIVCVSARSGVGVPELLDALALCCLPPSRIVRHARNEAGRGSDRG